MSKKYADEPDDRMEAPCMCRCGNWFDLDDGCRSERFKNELICEECSKTEEEEIERQEEIDELIEGLSEAEWTIRFNHRRLTELRITANPERWPEDFGYFQYLKKRSKQPS